MRATSHATSLCAPMHTSLRSAPHSDADVGDYAWLICAVWRELYLDHAFWYMTARARGAKCTCKDHAAV